jgi:hypothetical protein
MNMPPTTPQSRSATQRPTVPAQRGEPAAEREHNSQHNLQHTPQHAAPPTARDARGRFLPRPPAHALHEPVTSERPIAGPSPEADSWDDLVGGEERATPTRRPFTFAGLRWKPDEDRVDGAWIGYRLATEFYHGNMR